KSHQSAARFTFQDLTLAESRRQGRSGHIDRAAENFHAEALLFQVRAESALAICRQRGIGNLDVINVMVIGQEFDRAVSFVLKWRVVLRHKVEGGISLFERYAVKLVAVGVQRQLMEKQLGELAQASGGTVFKFHFSITAAGCGELETLLDRHVEHRRYFFLRTRPLEHYRATH